MNDNSNNEVLVIHNEYEIVSKALPKLLGYRPERGTLILGCLEQPPTVVLPPDVLLGLGAADQKDIAATLAIFIERTIFGVLVSDDLPGVDDAAFEAAFMNIVNALGSLGVTWLSRQFIGIERADEVFGHLPTREEWLATTSEEEILANYKRAEVEALRRIAELSDPA